MTKKILVFTDSNTRCGVGQFNIQLLEALTAAGYRTAYFQRREESTALQRLESLGVETFYLDANPDEQPLAFANDRRLPARLYTNCSPDLVFLSNGHPLLSFGAVNTALFLGYPYVICEGLVAPQLLARDPDEIAAYRLHYLKARAVVAMGENNAALLNAHYGLPDTCIEVVNPVPAEPFFSARDSAARARIRREWGVDDDTVVCLTVAKFETIKGHDLLRRAFQTLKQDALWERLHFVWAGDGTRLDDITAGLPPGKVSVIPFRSRVWELLDAADIFLLPSRAEGLPRVIVEAMAKGLPTIATAVGGSPEALGDTGLTVPGPRSIAPGEGAEGETVEALAASILRLAGDADLRADLGDRAATRARETFGPGTEIARHLKIIEHALKAG